jgi:hypothetical protein
MSDINPPEELPLQDSGNPESKPKKGAKDREASALHSERKSEKRDSVAVVPAQTTATATSIASKTEGTFEGLKQPLTIAFLITLGVGIVAELVNSEYSVLLAAAAMMVYFVFGMRLPDNIRNTERFADSLYYLGFILTLWALCIAMLPLPWHSPNLTSLEIIPKFGIAIVTTFLGMSLRIILIQLRPTVSDQHEEASTSIAKYISTLNDELRTAIKDIKNFRRHTLDEAQQTIEKTRATTEAVNQNLRDIGAMSSNVVEESNKVIVKRIEDSMTDLAGRLRELVLLPDLDGINQNISGLRKSLGLINDQLAQVAHASAESTENAQRFAQGTSDAAVSIGRFREQASEFEKLLATVRQQVVSRNRSVDSDLTQASNEIKTSLEAVGESMRAFSKTMINSANVLRDAIQEAKNQK